MSELLSLKYVINMKFMNELISFWLSRVIATDLYFILKATFWFRPAI